MKIEEKSALVSLFINIILFFIKIFAAMLSGSIAVLSSAFDSLNDIISYLIGYYSIKESSRGPDQDHPFGHRRMEPLAGMLIAVFAGILSFEILKSAISNLLSNSHTVDITIYTFGALIITIIVKVGMHISLKNTAKKTLSAALDAMSVDSRNDVLSNSVALIGVIGAYFGHFMLDDIAAIIISIYIAYSGYMIARKNFDYIVGARPDESTVNLIAKKAKIPGVKKVARVRAHYVGDRIHTEIVIILEKNTPGPESHSIAVRVQRSVESIQEVSHAFIHIDYN
ncbi:cation diffusion facilitator family transporter [Candidatus Micrarchaeota archaeon]|nr:cation diffusion facilitator family transporter [Candidatus Micrarchaeota archaeon]MBU1165802.1 cation diffusion facilitator family transporter [Candidatus Micrarchaeota archaeon]MBU1886282.1 cation diffusion facilitator family transporter [Candidatus Micrarchaeota archaeon]